MESNSGQCEPGAADGMEMRPGKGRARSGALFFVLGSAPKRRLATSSAPARQRALLLLMLLIRLCAGRAQRRAASLQAPAPSGEDCSWPGGGQATLAPALPCDVDCVGAGR